MVTPSSFDLQPFGRANRSQELAAAEANNRGDDTLLKGQRLDQPVEPVQAVVRIQPPGHGSSCAHCNMEVSRNITAKDPSQLKSLAAQAASDMHGKNKAAMLESTRQHEIAHQSTAQAAGLITGPIVVNEDGSGSVQIAMPISPEAINPEQDGAATLLQKTLGYAQGMVRAALAPGDPSSQDRSVAAKGAALQGVAQAKLGQAQQLEREKTGTLGQPNALAQSSRTQNPFGNFSPSSSMGGLRV